MELLIAKIPKSLSVLKLRHVGLTDRNLESLRLLIKRDCLKELWIGSNYELSVDKLDSYKASNDCKVEIIED